MDRYQVRKKPGCIRVVDRKKDRVDGYWWPDSEEWVDFHFLYMEEPADLIPRMQNIRERLTGHDETELQVAKEIVDYVIKQLEQMSDQEITSRSGAERLLFICYEGHPFWVEGYEEEIPNCPECGDRTMRNSRIHPDDISTIDLDKNLDDSAT